MRRYRARTVRTSAGFGFVPFFFVMLLAAFMWHLHGGHIPGLESARLALFH